MNKQLFTLILSVAFVSPVFADESCCGQAPAVETAVQTEVTPTAEKNVCATCQKPVEECVCSPMETAPTVEVAEPVSEQPVAEEAPEMSDEEIELMIKKLIEQQQAQDEAQEQQPVQDTAATN